MADISIEILNNTLPVPELATEIVERKGVGHPDSICDSALEAAAIALSREYMERLGRIEHFNIDKGLLVAGQVEKGFGSGRLVKPMEMIVGDRATFRAGKEAVDVAGIVEGTIRGWFADNLAHLDSVKDLDVTVVLQPGSRELADIFSTEGVLQRANDTSAAVGYAPLSPLELAVYGFENFLNSPGFKARFPETGEDVKVMGFRRGTKLDITFAMPLFAGLINSEKEYFLKKAEIEEATKEFTSSLDFDEVLTNFNMLDHPGKGLDGVYLTLLGTSAEDADSGQIGRGNRVNGIIPLMRPIGTEAAAGKNPTSHVGKIYNVLANKVAREIFENVENLKEVYVWFLGRIGSPIDMPWNVSIQMIPASGFDRASAEQRARDIVEQNLASMEAFTIDLSMGRYPVC
ncbi:MAG: methionine adenosyltransferase [Thermodesulfobacteriota bacterium]